MKIFKQNRQKYLKEGIIAVRVKWDIDILRFMCSIGPSKLPSILLIYGSDFYFGSNNYQYLYFFSLLSVKDDLIYVVYKVLFA